jgi:hypothetical protein
MSEVIWNVTNAQVSTKDGFIFIGFIHTYEKKNGNTVKPLFIVFVGGLKKPMDLGKQ